MIPVGKMSWREISAMLGSCCSSMLFGLSYMFTKRIVGTVPVFSLLSWRFLMGRCGHVPVRPAGRHPYRL